MARLTSNKKDRQGKKTVAISGMARSSRDAIPWNDPAVDVWVLNEAIAHNYVKRTSLLSQMHPEWDYFRAHNFNDPLYPEFLRNEPWNDEHVELATKAKMYKDLPEGFPPVEVGGKRRPDDLEILLLEPNNEIAGKQTIYPFGDILETYGANKKRVRYFTSTAPYLIALAIYRGYERIEMYGFEMSSQEEYGYQKACTEFWLGIAIGKGIEVYLPPNCRLLGETEELYGYDKMPGFTPMHAEIRRNELSAMRANSQAGLAKIQGKKEQLFQQWQVAKNKKDRAWVQKLETQLGLLNQQEIEAIAQLNLIIGQWAEIDRVWRDLQAIPTAGEVMPVLPKKAGQMPKENKK